LRDAAEAKGQHVRPLPLGALFWKLATWPVGLFLRLYTGFVDVSSRVSVEGEGAHYPRAALYVNWHRYLPYLSVHHGKARRWLLVSKDAYMAPIVRWEQLHGVRTIRGGSGDGGRAGAALLVERLQAGDSAFLAVDGPRGPALHVKRGCVDVARAAGVPIIPVGYRSVQGRFHPRRWDHWLMPRPFDAIAVVYGRPLFLEADALLPDALERVAEGLREVSDSRARPADRTAEGF
jgi:lysophospholipid acyltransferase (LPLAT)-like uncharacterized protein